MWCRGCSSWWLHSVHCRQRWWAGLPGIGLLLPLLCTLRRQCVLVPLLQTNPKQRGSHVPCSCLRWCRRSGCCKRNRRLACRAAVVASSTNHIHSCLDAFHQRAKDMLQLRSCDSLAGHCTLLQLGRLSTQALLRLPGRSHPPLCLLPPLRCIPASCLQGRRQRTLGCGGSKGCLLLQVSHLAGCCG